MTRRALVLIVAFTLLAAACGARLSSEERAARVSAVGPAGGATEDAGGTLTGGDLTGEALTADGGGGVSGAGAVGASGGTVTGGGGGSGGSRTSGGGTAGGGATSSCKPSGASDTGVTAKQITVATVSDITGPSPGLFRSSHEAVQAYANYVNSRGGICGRALKVLKLDSKTDSGGNRAAVLDACPKAFALVGSMSAFDDGGASAVDDCKIPDVSAITVNKPRTTAQWAFPVFPAAQDVVSNGSAAYMAQEHPEAVKQAAIIWLNAAVTRNNAKSRVKAWKTAGFEFDVETEVQVVEPNYTPYVLDMRDKGIQYVTMISDINSQTRLLKAAAQQQWAPEVWDFDSSAYDPSYPVLAEGTAEGAHVFVNTALFEESGGNPEMRTYLDWLAKTVPGAEPDYFGVYAWSAAALFSATVAKLGPAPTRQKLADALKATDAWDGHGLHGAHRIGPKVPTNCFLYMKVVGTGFQRIYPSEGLDCDRGKLVDVSG